MINMSTRSELNELTRMHGVGTLNLAVQNITVEDDNPDYVARNGMLLSKNEKRLYFAFDDSKKTIVVPDTVTEITPYAFSSLKNVNECILPQGIQNLALHLFSYSSISKVVLPESVLTIDVAAFGSCNIDAITIPSKAKCGMFFLDPAQEMIDVTASAPFLGSNLSSISVSEGNPYYVSREGSLYSKDGKMLYKVPQKCTGNDEGCFIIPEGVELICGHAFDGCTRIKKVHAPSTLKEVGFFVFYNSTVETFELPKGIPCDVSYFLNEDDEKPVDGPKVHYYNK